MNILVTGCAGFIGYHVAKNLLNNYYYNVKIIGIDNINPYYDQKLKKKRLSILKKNKNFIFKKIDICNKFKIHKLFKEHNFKYVIHLAAQAGVRHSIHFPRDYIDSNLIGFFNIIENAKEKKIKHFIYASTSSVYGFTNKYPNNETDKTDSPLSLYAATKKSNEVLAYSYSNIHKLPTTGLRFFTVYGEWGRPDMALFKFTKSIIENKKINLYSSGNHVRDFTHVDDISNYILKLLDKSSKKIIPYQIFNVSSNNPKNLKYFLKMIEKNLGKKAKINKLPIQKGDVFKTHGSNLKIIKSTNIPVKVKFEDGIKRFIDWYKKHCNIK